MAFKKIGSPVGLTVLNKMKHLVAGKRIVFCSKCKEATSDPKIEVKMKNGKIVSEQYLCKDCKRELNS